MKLSRLVISLVALLLGGVVEVPGQHSPPERKQFEEYKKQAEIGNDIAQFNLGLCYAKGRMVSQDHAEAVKWYRKAAEQGNSEAQFFLGE